MDVSALQINSEKYSIKDSTARETADSANTTAQAAQQTANSANSTAQAAQQTANSANSTAQEALEKSVTITYEDEILPFTRGVK